MFHDGRLWIQITETEWTNQPKQVFIFASYNPAWFIRQFKLCIVVHMHVIPTTMVVLLCVLGGKNEYLEHPQSGNHANIILPCHWYHALYEFWKQKWTIDLALSVLHPCIEFSVLRVQSVDMLIYLSLHNCKRDALERTYGTLTPFYPYIVNIYTAERDILIATVGRNNPGCEAPRIGLYMRWVWRKYKINAFCFEL